MLNYPGNAENPDQEAYPKDYDPRPRPWYVRAVARGGATFGRPYADASGSGYLLACNRAIHGPDGALIGVAGVNVSLDIALELLVVPNVPPIQSAMLVDSTMGIVVSTTDTESVATVSLHGNKEKPVLPFRVPEVERHLREHHVNGVEIVGDSLYVFCLFHTLDWYLVVQFRTDDVLG